VISVLVLLGAVGFTLVAAYQWAGRLGASTLASRELAVRNWQGHVWQGHVWNNDPLASLVLRLGNIHARGDYPR
jgi:hypothetical protein